MHACDKCLFGTRLSCTLVFYYLSQFKVISEFLYLDVTGIGLLAAVVAIFPAVLTSWGFEQLEMLDFCFFPTAVSSGASVGTLGLLDATLRVICQTST